MCEKLHYFLNHFLFLLSDCFCYALWKAETLASNSKILQLWLWKQKWRRGEESVGFYLGTEASEPCCSGSLCPACWSWCWCGCSGCSAAGPGERCRSCSGRSETAGSGSAAAASASWMEDREKKIFLKIKSAKSSLKCEPQISTTLFFFLVPRLDKRKDEKFWN